MRVTNTPTKKHSLTLLLAARPLGTRCSSVYGVIVRPEDRVNAQRLEVPKAVNNSGRRTVSGVQFGSQTSCPLWLPILALRSIFWPLFQSPFFFSSPQTCVPQRWTQYGMGCSATWERATRRDIFPPSFPRNSCFEVCDDVLSLKSPIPLY